MLLMVACLSSKPLIEMKGQEDGGIWLECTSVGWYPEPRVVWRDPYGETMPTLEEAYTADADSLFMVTTAVIIRDYSLSSLPSGVSLCRGWILSRQIGTWKSFIPSTSPWMVALAVIVPTLLLLITGNICLIKKLHREKEILTEEKEVENEEKEIQ
ncbi:hypothetical protein HPG69_008808 [Diceros bicornis minor]|uniref:Butyrophilin subfamily 3 member A2-like Ig-C domain-containing protein n=1 Tax=Diceros bicornis minor TaxID=77932 RepID=A0A7J7FAX1_DICBM|nr:hypothetical protein HPG69_008808 [Diceros bicornis minor]